MAKTSPKDWVYATKSVTGKTYVSFAQKEGEVEEPLNEEKGFLKNSVGSCVEYSSTVYKTELSEETLRHKLESAGFESDTQKRVYILDYLESEGYLEEDDE